MRLLGATLDDEVILGNPSIFRKSTDIKQIKATPLDNVIFRRAENALPSGEPPAVTDTAVTAKHF